MLRAEVLDRPVDDTELALFRYLDANLRRGHEIRDIAEQLAHRLSRIGEDAQQARGAVQRVVVAVETLAKEHVARHLTGDRRMRLLHLVLDEGMSGLPHDRLATGAFNGIGERLRRLHVEDDRLARASPREDVTGIDNENSITPHDLTRLIDDADAIRVAIEGDADLRAVFFHGSNEILEILRYRGIRMMIREGPVALAKQASGR